MKRIVIVLVATILACLPAKAQLAITEVMSSSQNTPDPQHSDFWELTNFSTNSLDLTDYKFTDGTGDLVAAGANADVFDGLIIAPGESIILFEIEQNTEVAEFLSWWGETNLPAGIQIRLYVGPGLGSGGDGIQLWDAADNPVDSVIFGEATRGTSLTYSTNSGAFPVLSELGVGGAFTAGSPNADIGSPGYNAGAVPILVTSQPTNSTVSAGATAMFSVTAISLPRPRFQWQFNGTNISGEIASTLVITNAVTNNAGSYRVVIENGVQTVTSSNAVLTVTPAPFAPIFTLTPFDLNPTFGQTITLKSSATGFPIPAYQWQKNNVDLPGETGTQLTLSNVQTNDSATYKVIAYNTVGTNSASALVTVTAKPKLAVTEVQSSEAPGAGHTDWWELSNLDDHAVNLRGYRFDDNSQTIASGFTFTNDIIIRPGESIVFVQDISPAQYRLWWGLSPDVQVITYPDLSLGLSSGGDAINFWNATATDNSDKIAFASFSAAPNPAGRTFVYNPDPDPARLPNVLNFLAVNGVNGAFAATNNLDIGSPGRIVDPLVLSITPGGGGVILSWSSTPDRSYFVDYKDSLAANWTVLTNVVATGVTTSVIDAPTISNRVYRARVAILYP